MKREIKFRGKSIKTGGWLYGDLIHNRGKVYIADDSLVDGNDIKGHTDFEIDEETIGQYTGLKDKNGKEIYEGDIVRRKGEPDYVAEVIYDNGEFIGCGHYRLNGQIGWMLKQGFQLEVIGNIHDNPNLLEDAD